MKIQGFCYPGFCLCAECDPYCWDEERHPVFDFDESASTLYCDDCRRSLATVDGIYDDPADQRYL